MSHAAVVFVLLDAFKLHFSPSELQFVKTIRTLLDMSDMLQLVGLDAH